jgi:hypothetical protein
VKNVLFIPMETTPLPNARNYDNFNSILLTAWEDGGEARTKVKAAKDARKENLQKHGLPIPPRKGNMAKE